MRDKFNQLKNLEKFKTYNDKRHTHSLQLASLAKEKFLQLHDTQVTTKKFLSMTVEIDPDHKGISQTTLFRNEEIHQIFTSISPYCKTQKKLIRRLKTKKRKESSINNKIDHKVFDQFKNLRRNDLITQIEEMKIEINNKNRQIEELKNNIIQLKDIRLKQIFTIAALQQELSVKQENN